MKLKLLNFPSPNETVPSKKSVHFFWPDVTVKQLSKQLSAQQINKLPPQHENPVLIPAGSSNKSKIKKMVHNCR